MWLNSAPGWKPQQRAEDKTNTVSSGHHLMGADPQRNQWRTEERKCEKAGVSLHTVCSWGQGRSQGRTSSPAFSILNNTTEKPSASRSHHCNICLWYWHKIVAVRGHENNLTCFTYLHDFLLAQLDKYH